MLQEADHIKNIVVFIFRQMNSEVDWVLVSSEIQVLPQIILDPDYLPDYLSNSYNYEQVQPRFLLAKFQMC